MTKREGFRIALGFCAGLAVAAGVVFVFGRGSGAQAQAANTPPQGERVIRYIRERFGVPDAENLTLPPFQDSRYPGYYSTTVTAEAGTAQRTSPLSVSTAGRYLVLGGFVQPGARPT